MRYIKKYNNQLRYKVGDIVGYDKYVDSPSIVVEILSANRESKNPYFVSEFNPPNTTHVLHDDDLIDLTPEQQEEVDIQLNTTKYNL